MVATLSFKMDDGWRKYKRATNPTDFRRVLEKHVGQATLRNAQALQRRVRKRIQGGIFKKNAALTIMIKGENKPMVDGSDLFSAITHVQKDWANAFVGVLRTSGSFNVADIVHNGRSINVTDKMRSMFMLLWLVSEGRMPSSSLTGRAAALWKRAPGGWFPLKEGTTKIIIPPRPFIRSEFRLKSTKRLVKGNWERGLKRAFKEMGRR